MYSIFIPLVSRILLVTKNKDLGMMKFWPSLMADMYRQIAMIQAPTCKCKTSVYQDTGQGANE